MSQNRATVAQMMQIPMSRRDLLLLGSAGVASLAMLQLRLQHGAVPSLSLSGVRERLVAPLSVGFWSDADDLPVTDAALLPGGDARFVSDGARLRILGLYPRESGALSGFEMLDLDVVYAPHHDTRYAAWSFRNGSTPHFSSPVSLPVPVDAAAGLSLLLTWRATGASETQQSLVRLAVGQDQGVAKLRQGTYVVALPQADGTLPDWASHRVEQVERGLATLQRVERALGMRVTSTRPHLLFSVS